MPRRAAALRDEEVPDETLQYIVGQSTDRIVWGREPFRDFEHVPVGWSIPLFQHHQGRADQRIWLAIVHQAANITAKKMADCRWLKPELVGQFEFVEWTGENHLRHSRFIALRDDKRPEDVKRES